MKHVFRNISKLFSQPQPAQGSSCMPLPEPGDVFTKDFYCNLLRTINWIDTRLKDIDDKTTINFSTILRSVNPVYAGQPFYRYTNTYYNYVATPDTPIDYAPVLAQALAARDNDYAVPADLNQLGRVLRFEINVTTHDGAPCTESEGFVDESDILPINTWFYVTSKYLYCWIPASFIAIMQHTIEVEILGSYEWLKEANPWLYSQLMNALKEDRNRNSFH